jgi:hypothetical protein
LASDHIGTSVLDIGIDAVQGRRAADLTQAADVPLLSGETADSNDREDAEHWLAVYEELTALLRASDPPDGMLERYRLRQRFWHHRREQLSGPAPNRRSNGVAE